MTFLLGSLLTLTSYPCCKANKAGAAFQVRMTDLLYSGLTLLLWDPATD